MSEFSLQVTFQPTNQTKAPISFKICRGQCWLLFTNSGMFISNLFEWLEGKKYLQNSSISLHEGDQIDETPESIRQYIETVRFSTNNGIIGQYYQQRYQSFDNDEIITLRDFLNIGNNSSYDSILSFMGLDKIMHESLNMLSTGEYRKACLIKSALLGSKVMFIEDPYPGIDQKGRELIDLLLKHLLDSGTSIVIVASSLSILEWDRSRTSLITHCMLIQNDSMIFSGIKQNMPLLEIDETEYDNFEVPEVPDISFTNAFKLVDVSVRYDNRLILDHINWTVSKGDKWQLTGNNGAGKSLLLSLIYADNPQVYCNQVYIFGSRRGTGESIWDVKENIGFYSSEMFRYFDKSLNVEETIHVIVCQHPFKKKIWQQNEIKFKEDLLKLFNLQDNSSSPLYELSEANQRVVLLIAIFLKNSPLLILDEPFQNFDEHLTKKFLRFIDIYAKDRTLVFVTHNPEEIPGCINKWYALSEGWGCVS